MAGLTTITDTITYVDGAIATGQIVLSWPPFVTTGGVSIAGGQKEYPIAPDGTVVIEVYPNIGAQPLGTYYTATYELDRGPVYDEFWLVPASPSTTTIGAIRAQFPATPSIMINAQQLTGSGAQSGQFLGWSGSSWVPMFVSNFNCSVRSFMGRTGDVVGQTGDYSVDQITGAVPDTRQIIAGAGLTGGGPLTGNVTLAVAQGASVQQVIVLDDGTLVGAASQLNFQAGTGMIIDISLAPPNGVNIQLTSLGGGGGGAVAIYLVNGTVVGQRPQLNLVAGANISLVGVDDGADTVDVTIASTLASIWTENPDGSIYYLGGNVGIGTSTPGAALDVEANADADTLIAEFLNPGAVTAGRATYIPVGKSLAAGGSGYIAYVSDTGTPGNAYISLTNFGDSRSTQGLTIKHGGYVGIGTSTPQATLHVASGQTGGGNYWSVFVDPDSTGGTAPGMAFGKYGGVAAIATFGVATLAINPLGGNVGIGTAAPTSNLHVAATALATTATIGLVGQPGTLDLLASTNSGVGYVYISANLYYNGSAMVPRNTANDSWLFSMNCGTGSTGACGIWHANSASGPLTFFLSVLANGNVGIGTSNPGTPLTVASTANGQSSGIMVVASDYATNSGYLILNKNSGIGGVATLQAGDRSTPCPIALNPSGGGFVGIGNNAPGTLLSVSSASPVGTPPPNAKLFVQGGSVLSDSAPSGRISLGVDNNQDYGAQLGSMYYTSGNTGLALGYRHAAVDHFAIFMNAGYGANVGFQTTMPRGVLHVNDNSGGAAAVPALGNPSGLFNMTASGAWGLIAGVMNSGSVYLQSQRIDGVVAAYALLLQPNGNSVGIGTLTPRGVLHVRTGTDQNLAITGPQLMGGAVCINTANDAFGANTPFEIRSSATWFSNGNVGIGGASTVGSNLLDVGPGRTRLAANGEPFALRLDYSFGGTGVYLGVNSAGQFAISNNGGGAICLLDQSGNATVYGLLKVGGNAVPSQGGDLGISRNGSPGTAALYFGNSGGAYIYYDGAQFNFAGGGIVVPGWMHSTSGGVIFPDGSQQTTAATGSANDPRWVPDAYGMHSNNPVGIGLTNISGPWLFSQDLTYKPAGSSTAWYLVSDVRTKQAIREVEDDPVALLRALHWIRYEANGMAGGTRGKKAIGLIAQELADVFPEALGPPVRMKLRDEDADETEIMSLNYGVIYAHAVRAIAKLAERLEQLEQKLGANLHGT